jgi:fluoride ion exporter CrcB/FEX
LNNLKWTLGAVLTGFCSSLTTISSFVNDICKLPSVKRYVYVICTIVVANGLSCVILAIDLTIS